MNKAPSTINKIIAHVGNIDSCVPNPPIPPVSTHLSLYTSYCSPSGQFLVSLQSNLTIFPSVHLNLQTLPSPSGANPTGVPPPYQVHVASSGFILSTPSLQYGPGIQIIFESLTFSPSVQSAYNLSFVAS